MVVETMAGAEDTIYLCNFRVSVDGDWLCLKELAEGGAGVPPGQSLPSPGSPSPQLSNAALRGSFPSSPDGQEAKVIKGLSSLLPPSLFAPYAPICYERDPVSIERSNLVNICKLVVKELIESSLKYGRMLDSDSVPLQHFFIVLEHVLRHGLKPKRGILGPKKELWDLFQMVEKWTCEAQDITSSVRDLPTVSSHIGRARAWLRLALMQKKLPDYFRLLIEHRDDLLIDFYEPGSLMLSDEAIVIMGLLVGLNVIDCNLCVKEEELDSQMGVIDFSLYLRTTAYDFGDNPEVTRVTEDADMTTVLDQKNYIEELNRHLNATVTDLQSKVESLTTTNALMKEDLSIAKNTIIQLQDENDRLRDSAGITTRLQQEKDDKEAKKAARISVIGCEEELQDLQRHLEEESAHRKQIEKELELQIQMKAESEMAAKLLEKDIHEKQDTIVSLRQQLDDIKDINLEMYRKLMECEESCKRKSEEMSLLEAKVAEMTEALNSLKAQLEESEVTKAATQQLVQNLSGKVSEEELKVSSIETDLKIEREWRESLQLSINEESEAVLNLEKKTEELQKLTQDYESLQSAHVQLIGTVEDQERTLEELGVHLSESKLQMAEIKDVSKSLRDAQWAPDREAAKCNLCQKEFNITRRRHHCRNCGNIYCNACSDNTLPLPSSARPVRVCDSCHIQLLNRYSESH